jgi:hypothetical protein
VAVQFGSSGWKGKMKQISDMLRNTSKIPLFSEAQCGTTISMWLSECAGAAHEVDVCIPPLPISPKSISAPWVHLLVKKL